MSTLELALNDIACTGCIGKIKNSLKNCKGIEKVMILSGRAKITINYDEEIIQSEEIHKNVKKIFFRTFD